jgi:hypothetical protein
MLTAICEGANALDILLAEHAPTVAVAGHVSDSTTDQPSFQSNCRHTYPLRGILKEKCHCVAV